MKPILYLLEDGVCRGWHPFALTRPVGELLFGTLLLRERIGQFLGSPVAGYLSITGLEGYTEDGAIVEYLEYSRLDTWFGQPTPWRPAGPVTE
jgi:hypothetical protein